MQTRDMIPLFYASHWSQLAGSVACSCNGVGLIKLEDQLFFDSSLDREGNLAGVDLFLCSIAIESQNAGKLTPVQQRLLERLNRALESELEAILALYINQCWSQFVCARTIDPQIAFASDHFDVSLKRVAEFLRRNAAELAAPGIAALREIQSDVLLQRGTAFALKFPAMNRAQLGALIRALTSSRRGNARTMVGLPFVASADEFRRMRETVISMKEHASRGSAFPELALFIETDLQSDIPALDGVSWFVFGLSDFVPAVLGRDRFIDWGADEESREVLSDVVIERIQAILDRIMSLRNRTGSAITVVFGGTPAMNPHSLVRLLELARQYPFQFCRLIRQKREEKPLFRALDHPMGYVETRVAFQLQHH